MPSATILHSLFCRPRGARSGLLDLLLILMGVGLAWWLVPGLTEGAGF